MCTKSPAGASRKCPKTWCKGDGKTRVYGDSCTKSVAAADRKCPETWCKGDGRIRVCGEWCTKSAVAAGRKCPETWCKGDERTRVCGDSCTKSAAAASRAAPRAPTTPRAHQKKTIKNGTMVRQVHRSGALNWYAMWGRVRISSVLSERSVLQPFC